MTVLDGMIRVGAAVPRVYLADCKKNAQEICALLDEAAREGVRMLFERIDGRYDGPAREASVAHALVVRDSTAPPADG